MEEAGSSNLPQPIHVLSISEEAGIHGERSEPGSSGRPEGVRQRSNLPQPIPL